MAKKKEVVVKKDERFPRNLYKKGGKLVWGKGVRYSTVLVENESEFEEATEHGYLDSFSDALFGEEDAPKEDDPKEDAPKEDAPKEDAPAVSFPEDF